MTLYIDDIANKSKLTGNDIVETKDASSSEVKEVDASHDGEKSPSPNDTDKAVIALSSSEGLSVASCDACEGHPQLSENTSEVRERFSRIITHLDSFTERLTRNPKDQETFKNAMASLRYYKEHSSMASSEQKRIVAQKMYRFISVATELSLIGRDELALLDPRTDEYAISLGRKLVFSLDKCKGYFRRKHGHGEKSPAELEDELNDYMDKYSVGLERNRDTYFSAMMKYIENGYTETVQTTSDEYSDIF